MHTSRFFRNVALGFAGFIALLPAVPGRADSVAIVDPSFENPALPPGATGTPVGWSGGNSFNPTGVVSTPDPAFGVTGGPAYTALGYSQIDGSNVAWLNLGSMRQVLSGPGSTIAFDTVYTLKLLVGDRSDIDNSNIAFSYGLYDMSTSSPTFLAGASNVSESAAFGSALASKGGFITVSAAFDSGSLPAGVNYGDVLGVILSDNGSGNDGQYDFDNVRLDATSGGASAAPLPRAFFGAMPLFGMLAVTAFWRKRQRSQAI